MQFAVTSSSTARRPHAPVTGLTPALLAMGVAMLLVLQLLIESFIEVNTGLMLASIALLAICIAFAATEARKGDNFSPLALYSYLYIVHFVVAGFVFSLDPDAWVYRINAQYAMEAQIIVILSLAAFASGYLALCVKGRHTSRAYPSVFRSWSAIRVLIICLVLFTIGWLTRIYVISAGAYFQITRTIPFEGAFHAAIRMAESLPMNVLCIVSIFRWSANKKGLIGGRLFWFVLVAEFLYWLPTGRKEEIILTLILPILARYLLIRKFPSWPLLLLLGSFILLLFPLAHYYRLALELGALSKGDIFSSIEAAVQQAQASDYAAQVPPHLVLLNRLALLEPVSACIRLVESGQWGFLLGSSYFQAILGLVPRFLWPGKPDLHYGTEFGHAAGMAGPTDWESSTSVTFVGESFLNLSWAGPAAFLGFGFFFGAIYLRRDRTIFPQTWILLYLLVVPVVLYIGGTFALYFGGLAKLLPFYYVIGRIMTRRLRPLHQKIK